jgi:transposase
MASIAPMRPAVIGGVDTHKDLHMAAIIGTDDNVLDTAVFPTTRTGYRALLAWMRGHGRLARVGMEGTGCYGAGLHRYLTRQGIEVLEVARPDRAERRRRGKNDTLDAQNAAHAARDGRRVVTAKARTGLVEVLRTLRATRTAAVAARREALQVLDAQMITAPEELRDQLRGLTRMRLVRTLATSRPSVGARLDLLQATTMALGSLARRIVHLDDEIAELDELIAPLVRELAPSLLAAPGFGIHTTAQLLVTMGDNPQRITTEPRFAKLCGAAPLDASSGKTQDRHRLNRGGDRGANSALYLVVLNRMRYNDRTRTYVERRTTEGKTKGEIIRCLKRYAAREAYYLIKHDHEHPERTPTHP